MDDRAIRLQEDLAALKSIAEDCIYLNILNSSLDSIHLQLLNPIDKNGSLEIVFNFSTHDYPQGTVISVVGPNSTIPSEARPLLDLVATKCYEWCHEWNLELPQFVVLRREEEKMACSEKPLDNNLQPLLPQISVGTTASNNGASDTDMDAYDGYDYDEEEEEEEEESYVNAILELEISQVQQKFGHNSIDYRIHAGIDEMDLFFKIDLNNFLDSYTGSAWGINLEQPLVILLHIRSVSKYLDGVEPLLEVFQESQQNCGEKIKVGMGVQLKKIMEEFVSTQWKELSNSKMTTILGERVDSEGETKTAGTGSLDVPIAVARQNSLGAQMSKLNDPAAASQADKAAPSLKDGFLVQFLQYALNRIHSLNEFCVICDERHIVETGLLKPCVCTRELCVFAFQTLGVMADAAEAIATDADVVDLLIAMANAAANSSRCELILDPYPSIVDPNDSALLALDPKKKDFKFVRCVFEDVVKCREQVVKGRVSNFEQSLEGRHYLTLPLMQWIVATCRAHVVVLPQERLLKSMKTKYQFLLISSPPKKEIAFKSAKDKYGSTFAFHGSNIENWHSIMRIGLINASGTKYQLHGAVHGNGIYLSPNSNVSFGYASTYPSSRKKGENEQECLAGRLDLKCLALCEVVTKDLRKNNDIWVSLNPDFVCTRFFFVYDKSSSFSSHSAKTSTSSSEFRQEIDHAMEYIQTLKSM